MDDDKEESIKNKKPIEFESDSKDPYRPFRCGFWLLFCMLMFVKKFDGLDLKAYEIIMPLLFINITMVDTPLYKNRRVLYFLVNLVLIIVLGVLK